MDFLLEILRKPFTELRGDQQAFAVLILLLGVVVALSAVLHVIRGMKGRRRHWRRPQTGPVDMSWKDSVGSSLQEQGRCVDLSTGGLRVELQGPILVGTPVAFRLHAKQLAGTAFVRHCTRADSTFLIGVEFARSR